MSLYNFNKTAVIYPWEQDQVNSLVRKWRISANQLNEAILETGSINRRVIRQYLEQKGVILSFGKLMKYIRVNYLHKA